MADLDFLTADSFNMVEYFLDHNLAARGDKVAIRFEDQALSYRQVIEASHRAGNVLRDLGVEPEQRVLFILPDRPEFATTWFGTLRIGGICVMVNPYLNAADFQYYLNYSRAAVAVVDETVLDRVRPAVEQTRYLKNLLVIGNTTRHPFPDYERLIEHSSPECETFPTSPNDVACWLFTAGATGKPKANVHFHHDFPYSTEHFARDFMGMREDDVTLSVPKLFFGYATGTNLMFPFAVGATTCLFTERATAKTLYEKIDQFRPTVLTQAPSMITAMLAESRLAERHQQAVAGIRFSFSAGEALPPELYRRWKAAFDSELCDGIGSAEMFHVYISNRPGDVKPGSLGRIVPGYEARIVGDDGREVAPGEIGRLQVTGDSAAAGYWQDHAKTKATFAGDTCFTADMFSKDAEGYYYNHGRGVFVAPL